MSGQEGKSVSATKVTIAELIQPNEANYLGKAFGGALLSKIDLCAYATASRFAAKVCVTASFDRVDFHEPIEVGELVTLEGTVGFVGRTSVEVIVEVYAENVRTGHRRHTNTARVTMVALEDLKPSPVPQLICETREDRIRFLQGKLRRELRTKHRAERAALEAVFERLTDDKLLHLIAAKEIEDEILAYKAEFGS